MKRPILIFVLAALFAGVPTAALCEENPTPDAPNEIAAQNGIATPGDITAPNEIATPNSIATANDTPAPNSIATANDTPAPNGIIAPGATLEKLADGFTFTEGPAADAHGNVYFTDQPNDRIMRWNAADGTVTEFLSPSGRANGLCFDLDGNLLAAADEQNQIWSIAPDGSHTVLARRFDSAEYNGPNDLWMNPKTGTIYFTDPLYARDYWTHRTSEQQQDGEHVYGIFVYSNFHSRRAISRVADDLEKPNGIVGTPNGRTLYIADIGADKTYAYNITRSGKLKRKRLFAPLGSDGMTIDSRGNVYLTGHGVTVFNPAGEQIEHIEVPAGWTANVCFGGTDGNLLFITALDAVYGIRMNVKGVKYYGKEN